MGLRKPKGFTLVEMSIVLIVIGLVILIVFPAMQAVRINMQRNATNQNLQTLLRATTAFVHTAGCLPCPTPASASGSGFGRVGGTTGSSLCGVCSASLAEGIPPFVSLGIPASAAKDGWGRWITMRIDPALAINFGVVPPTSPCVSGDGCTIGLSQKGLCRSGLATTNRISVLTPSGGTQEAAVLFVSHGPNGYGAYTASPISGYGSSSHYYNGPASSCSTGGGYELCNANGDTGFVDAEATTNPSDPFDDSLIYMNRNALVAFLGQGTCQTTW